MGEIIQWWVWARVYESALDHQDLSTPEGRAVNQWLYAAAQYVKEPRRGV
jgi:hypothetical protein